MLRPRKFTLSNLATVHVAVPVPASCLCLATCKKRKFCKRDFETNFFLEPDVSFCSFEAVSREACVISAVVLYISKFLSNLV